MEHAQAFIACKTGWPRRIPGAKHQGHQEDQQREQIAAHARHADAAIDLVAARATTMDLKGPNSSNTASARSGPVGSARGPD